MERTYLNLLISRELSACGALPRACLEGVSGEISDHFSPEGVLVR